MSIMKPLTQALLDTSFLYTPSAPTKDLVNTTGESERPGVPPSTEKDCPPTHPIKGNFTTYSDERCIYHVEGQRYYIKTKPERCYAARLEAVLDGCRASKV